MATRSVIIIPPAIDPVAGSTPNPAFPFVGIYCHWDGYPEGVGATLREHYTDDQKITTLMRLGALSSLAPLLVAPVREAVLAQGAEEAPKHTFEKPVEGVTVAYHRDRGEELRHYYAPTLAGLLSQARDSWCEYAYLRDTDDPTGWRTIEL
jgi:hypothetical protein